MLLNQKKFWLIKDADPIPIGNKSQRFFRTPLLAHQLGPVKGHQVTWFASRFEHGRKLFIEQQSPINLWRNVNVVLLEGCGYKNNISLKRIRHNRELAKDFINKASKLELPDIVLIAYPCPELCQAATEFCLKHNIPYVLDFRDPWPDSFVNYLPFIFKPFLSPLLIYYRKIIKEAISNACAIVSMSDNMLEWALSYAKNNSNTRQTRVFPLGYSASSLLSDQFIEESSLSSNLNCIFIGMFGKTHNGKDIIEAFNRLKEAGENNIKLYMAGDGPLKEEWMSLAKDNKNITFTGWLNKDQIESYLTKSHIGLILLGKGIKEFWFGNKIFEYLSKGLALITDASCNLNNLIEKEGVGFSIKDNTSTDKSIELAKLIKKYKDNRQLLTQYRKRAVQLFNLKFNAKKIYPDYADFLLSLIN